MVIKLLIVDADGTVTPMRGSSTAPFKPVLMPNVASVCAEMLDNGAVITIASNQSPSRHFGAIQHQLKWTKSEIGALTYDYSRFEPCRKPSPAMLVAAMTYVGVTPSETLMVGDQDTDRQAAEAAGCAFQWAADFFGWNDLSESEVRKFWNACYANGVSLDVLPDVLRDAIKALPAEELTGSDEAMRIEVQRHHSTRRSIRTRHTL